MRIVHSLLLALPLCVWSGEAGAPRAELEPIVFHDNDVPAGSVRNGVREITVEIRRGLWRPNGPTRPGTPMMAFAEPGKPLRLPGPLIRVVVGTRLSVTVHNATDSAIVLRGLLAQPSDSLVLEPGRSSTVRSLADVVGSRFYFGTFAGGTLRGLREGDAHLAGAIVIDPPGIRARDDIFVITESEHARDSTGVLMYGRPVYALNGRPWPYTRRMRGVVGDSAHYRVLNATPDIHPIHLHGTFFRVVARGGAWRDTVLSDESVSTVATQLMPAGSTMAMAWMPDRPGTWLMHCHLTFHVTANIGFGADSLSKAAQNARVEHGHGGDPDHHVEESMGGLFMTIEVPPPAGWSLPPAPSKVITFAIPRDSLSGDRRPAFAPTITDVDHVERPIERQGPGAMLLLQQHQPTTVRVVNNSGEHTAIHWHGMELENLYDGVVGVGGTPGQRTRAVAPGGGTFDARMTPPRAGTFIYHTHLMEVRQQESGLYGAMIVLPAGETWDATRDHVFVLGTRTGVGAVLNGVKVAPELEIRAGEPHRLRLINISTGSTSARFQLVRPDTTLVQWTPLAKDAIDLAPSRRVPVASRQPLSMGETYDVLFTPSEAAEYRMEVRNGAGVLIARQIIRVVAKR